MPNAVCLKVAKNQGEEIIALAGRLGLIEKSLIIQKIGDQLCIPLSRQPQQAELETLKGQASNLQLTTAIFMEKRPAEDTLTQVLEKLLPPELHPNIPHSLDIIGDIAIIEIPPQLEAYKGVIGQAILKTHKNVKTALAKAGAISGVYRVRELNLIAGENKTRTIYHEYGCVYHVDVAKAYFSPRLSHEHQRVASLVQAGETVVDLFAGVGPFSVLIAKGNPSVKVYAVDINPEAVELLKINARVNRVENRLLPILGDARQLANGKLCGVADRVIMNLPETAIDFVDAACQAVKPQGGIIHFYGFVRKPDTIEELKKRFSEATDNGGRKVVEFLVAKSVRETAPYEAQVVLDVKIL
jgi:tRNA (guanine37-N1)-methyltransferase